MSSKSPVVTQQQSLLCWFSTTSCVLAAWLWRGGDTSWHDGDTSWYNGEQTWWRHQWTCWRYQPTQWGHQRTQWGHQWTCPTRALVEQHAARHARNQPEQFVWTAAGFRTANPAHSPTCLNAMICPPRNSVAELCPLYLLPSTDTKTPWARTVGEQCWF